MSVAVNNTIITIVETKARKCGVCHEPGHDKRTCPVASKEVVTTVSAPKIDKEAILANHYRFLSRKETGPGRLIDPDKYWSNLGPDSGTYPFERDHKGALHMPQVLNAGYTYNKEVMKISEYKWDSEKKLFYRIGECPGCSPI